VLKGAAAAVALAISSSLQLPLRPHGVLKGAAAAVALAISSLLQLLRPHGVLKGAAAVRLFGGTPIQPSP